jgi:hypothetical protein
MMQYHKVTLNRMANKSAATTITASDKRKQWQMGEIGKGNVGCAVQKCRVCCAEM